MRNDNQNVTICIISFLILLLISCNGQNKSLNSKNLTRQLAKKLSANTQIADYIRNIYQDKNGNFWFGTNGYGVAHYNGDSVSYFSNRNGFNGKQITGISEDPEQNIWFATDQGIVKCEAASLNENIKQFTNYTDSIYFEGKRFWSVFADKKGIVWAGSVTGIFRFDGITWVPFNLPYPEEIKGEFITNATSWSITEDKMGNMWFSTNGYGAYKYVDKSFIQYTKEQGLADDSVDNIMEDSKGNIWFGTRYGGVSKFDGKTFTNYTANDSIGNNEVCVIYESSDGDIWLSSEGFGVYRYNGESFVNYSEDKGLKIRAVQTIFEDRDDRLWVGGGGGLYLFDQGLLPMRPEGFTNVTKYGPWQ